MPLEEITFVKSHFKTPSAERAIQYHADTNPNLRNRPVAKAVCRSTPKGNWHANDNDSKKHITVDYQDKDGGHLTTHHVYYHESEAEKKSEEKSKDTVDEEGFQVVGSKGKEKK